MKRKLQQLCKSESLPLGGVRRGFLLLALVAIMMPIGAWAQEEGESTACEHSEYTNGFCTACGGYQPATLIDESNRADFGFTDATYDGYYAIANAGNLYWFANKVNTEGTLVEVDGYTLYESKFDAVLTADITVNDNLMEEITIAEDGTATVNEGAAVRNWELIGFFDSENGIETAYAGTFDGKNHTISGLYFNDGERICVGLFGAVGEGGIVKNVNVAQSYFYGQSNVGGVAGGSSGAITNCSNSSTVSGSGDYVGGVVGVSYGTVQSCSNSGAVSGSSYYVGGVVGQIKNGTIESCTNSGTISGNSIVGGVVGSNSASVTNCYNIGSVSGEDSNVGGVVGSNAASLTNCYSAGTVSGRGYIGGVAGSTNGGTVANCYFDNTLYDGPAVGLRGSGTVDALTSGKSSEAFASGEVAWLLGVGCTVGEGDAAVTYLGTVWGQAIGTDAYPLFSNDKVYYGYVDCTAMVYTNNSQASDEPVHPYEGGFCTVCDRFNTSATEVVITDGKHASFSLAEDMALTSLTYLRTLPNQKWNPLYVPFEIEVTEALLANYDVAQLSRVYTTTDAEGTVDNMEIEKLTSGIVEANRPYFIRAKSEAAQAMDLTVTDATLKATATESVSSSSDAATYTLVPVYTAMTRTDMATDIRVITADGVWARMREGSTLNPFRFYLTITPTSSAASAPVTVRIVTRGEGTTGIDPSTLNPQLSTLNPHLRLAGSSGGESRERTGLHPRWP